MSELYSISEYPVAPGDGLTINKTAGYVRCLEASGPFKISLNNGERADFEAGLGVEADFTKVRIENPGTSVITVKLGFADRKIDDSRMVLSGSVAVGCGGSEFTDDFLEISNTPTLLLAANSGRTSAVIRAGDSPLCIGPNGSVTYQEPATIGAGQSMTIAHKGEVWGVREVAGTDKAGIYEEKA